MRMFALPVAQCMSRSVGVSRPMAGNGTGSGVHHVTVPPWPLLASSVSSWPVSASGSQRDRNTSYTAPPTACADGARIRHDRRMDAAAGDVVIRLAHDEALTRECAWLAGQSFLQDRHPGSGRCGRSERHCADLARALIRVLAGYRSRTRTL